MNQETYKKAKLIIDNITAAKAMIKKLDSTHFIILLNKYEQEIIHFDLDTDNEVNEFIDKLKVSKQAEIDRLTAEFENL